MTFDCHVEIAGDIDKRVSGAQYGQKPDWHAFKRELKEENVHHWVSMTLLPFQPKTIRVTPQLSKLDLLLITGRETIHYRSSAPLSKVLGSLGAPDLCSGV